jgi:hypothetical protein
MTSTPASMSAVPRSAAKLALTLALALSSSCASFKPPALTSGPSVSPEGIELVVAAQSCTQSSEPDWLDADLAEAVLDVHVSNRTIAPLRVRRDDFRLVTPDGYALRTLSWGAAEPLIVVRDETRAFRLRFQARGIFVCGRELWLDPRAGLVVGRRLAAIDPVRFVPWRSRTAVGVASASTPTPAF